MYSYKEFPEQVINEITDFANQYEFVHFETCEDHCVRYRNENWELFFYCNFGAIELSLVNLSDGYSYRLTDVIGIFFPESKYFKESKKNVWGSLKTVCFKIEALKEHYSKINDIYPQNRDKLSKERKTSWILTDFISNNGSKELKKMYEPSNDLWLEKASFEYNKYYKVNTKINNKTTTESPVSKLNLWSRISDFLS